MYMKYSKWLILSVVVTLIVACSGTQLVKPTTTEDKIQYVKAQVTSLYDTLRGFVEQKRVSKKDAVEVLKQIDKAGDYVKAAELALKEQKGQSDIDMYLRQALVLTVELEAIIRERAK